jgi:hypothetical protein
MWATLALAAALSLAPQQGGQLKLTNDRATYGLLGSTRTESKLLPGDSYFVSFDIENLDVGEDGSIMYSMQMELLNSKGKQEYGQEPQDLTAKNDLGGNRMPGFARADIGTDTAPGEYTLKLTVTDRRSKQKAELTRKFEVLPKEFGLVRVQLAYFGQAPVPAPPLAVAGQALVFNCGAVNFQREKEKDQPNFAYELVVLDEQGGPVLKKPFSDELTMNAPKTLQLIPISVPLQLNRAGKFTLKLTATDRLAKKTASVSLPIQVLELKEK